MSKIKLFNNDYTKIMEGLKDNSIDLIITDPPYLHVKGGMKSKKYNTGTWKKDSEMVTKMSDFDREKIFEFLDYSLRKLKKANMYVFCSKLQLIYYFEYLSEHKKLKYDLLVWDKMKYSMKSTKFYTSDIEYIVRIYEAGVSLNKVLVKDGSKSDIQHYMKRQAYVQPKGVHNTMKPIELIENFVRVASEEGDIVLDTFMGSGTTGVACMNTNRNFVGIELEESYFDMAKQRIEEATMDNSLKY